jgi:hypothetical protein
LGLIASLNRAIGLRNTPLVAPTITSPIFLPPADYVVGLGLDLQLAA